MAVNSYFQNGTTSEQDLYENLVIESIQIHGLDVYYIPRKILKKDLILNEEVLAEFDDAYQIEMYVDSVDGFEGDGKLLERFGLEVRDQINLVVANSRRNSLIGDHGYAGNTVKPNEGDLIYIPMMSAHPFLTSTASRLMSAAPRPISASVPVDWDSRAHC